MYRSFYTFQTFAFFTLFTLFALATFVTLDILLLISDIDGQFLCHVKRTSAVLALLLQAMLEQTQAPWPEHVRLLLPS